MVQVESELFSIDTRSAAGPGMPEGFIVEAESVLFVINTRELRAAAVTESGLFTINTLAQGIGGIRGRVLAAQQPIAGAEVTIEGQEGSAQTAADGGFEWTGIPAGSGYVLWIGAPGFLGKRIDGVRVTSSILNLGDIVLTPLRSGLALVRLDPDVNPGVSEVGPNGIAYRYYRVVDSAGRPAGGQVVQVRRSDGIWVPQVEERSHDWAGRTPGVADGDGLVRVAVPADFVGSQTGDERQFNITISGQDTGVGFSVRRIASEYDQVWKHKVGGGVSGKVTVLQVGGKGAFETVVRRTLASGIADHETITRQREVEIKVGVEAGAGVKIVAGATGEIGAGGLVSADLWSAYRFDPESTSASENAMKLYVALGDELMLGTGPAMPLFNFLRTTIEPMFLDTHLEAAGGEVRLGSYVEGGFMVGMKAGKKTRVGLVGEASGERAMLAGYEERYLAPAHSRISVGLATRGQAALSVGAAFGTKKKSKDLQLSLFDVGRDTQFRGSLVSDYRSLRLRRVELDQSVTLGTSDSPKLKLYQKFYVGAALDAGRRVEWGEKLSFALPDEGALERLSVEAPIWDLMTSGDLQGTVFGTDQPAAMTAAVLASAFNDGTSLDYNRSVYAADELSVDLGFKLDPAVAALGISIEGGIERGAEMVNEKGRIWRYKRMALEAYPGMTDASFPNQSILELEARWAINAASVFKDLLHEAVDAVKEVGETIVEIGSGVAKGVLKLNPATMAAGAIIESQWFRPEQPVQGLVLMSAPPEPVDDGYLPAIGAGNYVYGISGIYRFASTNTLNEPAELALSYTDADASGLEESTLRVYRLPDGANRWEFIGGTVDTNANAVTVMVTNLGTFALAPPMPSGGLVLRPGGDRLPADGQTTMTISVSNLVLNTGTPASGPWLYTVAAEGVEVIDNDVRPDWPGVQLAATNAAIEFSVRAPLGGRSAMVRVESVAGDARGDLAIALWDEQAPAAPSNIVAIAGQSRIWLSWSTSIESDVAGYRVYYRAGQAGPPWDGTAAVEGSPSPVAAVGTNTVLRGLEVNQIYHLAISAVDGAGNESPLAPVAPVTTVEGPPQPAAAVAVRFGTNGAAQLMWTLSEDDGYNDRDVVRYDVLRAIRPGGEWSKAAEVSAGSEMFIESAPAIEAGQFIRYALVAVDRQGASSDMALSSRFMEDGRSADNDWDGMADGWENQFGLDPEDPNDGAGDPDMDGLSNLQEYLSGSDPGWDDSFRLEVMAIGLGGALEGRLIGPVGRTYTVEVSPDLSQWQVLTNFPGTNAVMPFVDEEAGVMIQRFYRAVSPAR